MKYSAMRFADGEDRVSLLGFGCMRFPKTEDGKIDEEQAGKMLALAIEGGVNYIDTAYPYHDGDSEPFVGRVLAGYPREKFFLATKLPVWKVNTPEEAQSVFEEQMDRLQVSYVDYYLFHALDKERWEKLKKSGIISWVEQMKEEGKIRHLGFSFHDNYEVFREIITYRQWDFCQIQYNYVDRDVQAGDRGYILAHKMGIPLIVMEPVKGGTLASLPEEIESVFKEADPEASPASWALRWVGSHSNVKIILSGMSTMDQVQDNLNTFKRFEPLSVEEESVVERAENAIKARIKNGCTSCRYCMPCPSGVDIPGCFSIWNEWSMYGGDRAEEAYSKKKQEKAGPDMCVKCGKCEKVCPQGLKIREDLGRMAAELGKREVAGEAEA